MTTTEPLLEERKEEPFTLPEEDRPFVSNILYLYAKRLEELAMRPELSDEEQRRLGKAASRANRLSHLVNPAVDHQFHTRGREAPVGVRTGLMYPRRS